MFLFDFLFGSRKNGGAKTREAEPATAPAVEVSAPGTSIHFDPNLITGLKDDHQLLLEVFTATAGAAQIGDLAEVQKRLGYFRTLLTDHLLKENVRLYIYLEHLLQKDAISHQLVHEFRHEMDVIGRVVVSFLGKYKEIASQPELATAFATDLAAIGEALVARIKREEETLYPMYCAPAG